MISFDPFALDEPKNEPTAPPREFDPTAPLQPGTTLLEASAGTGKTYSITSVFLRLVIEYNIPIEKILVVTFTQAATAELSTRIRKRLGEVHAILERHAANTPHEAGRDLVIDHLVRVADSDRLEHARRARDAVESFDRAQISTIHGFCQRMLQQHALEAQVPFGIELAEDQAPLEQEIATDFWARQLSRLAPIQLQLLQLAGINHSSVRALVRTAIGNLEAQPTPPADANARPDAPELLEALEAAADAARDPSAVGAVRDLMHAYTTKAKDVDQALRSLDALARRAPSNSDYEPLDHIRRAARKLRPERRPPVVQAVIAFLEAYDRWRPIGDRWALALRHEIITFARSELERRARSRGLWSFDDLLRRMSAALEHPDPAVREGLKTAVRARFRAVLIDEFQDTDPIQWAIFARLFRTADHRLFLIGDPKQAIYSFRRADVNTYIAARDTADHTFTLSRNWRSDPPLISALNALFERKQHPFANGHIGYQRIQAPASEDRPLIDGLGPPLRLLWVERTKRNTNSRYDPTNARISKTEGEQEIPELVASDIVRTLERGLRLPSRDGGPGRPVRPSDMAVLVPKNKQASQIQAALQRRGVPAVIHGPFSVFETEEARELEYILAAILEPSKVRLLRKALVTRIIGVTARELARMDEEDPKALEAWVDRLRQWRDDWNNRSFIEGFRKLISFRVEAILALEDGERRLANLLQLGEILHLSASERGLKAPGLLAWFKRQLEGKSEEKHQVRLETDEPAVQIVTIHKSKGLEYPFVWCPFLWQAPNSPGGFRKNEEFVFKKHDRLLVDIDVNPESFDRRANAALKLYDLRAENLRQLYVALTRAKHQVTIYAGAYWALPESALGYLLFAEGSATDDASLNRNLNKISNIHSLRDNELMARAVHGLSRELISVSVAEKPLKRRVELPAEPVPLDARAFDKTRRLDTDWRRTSFSGLAAELSRTPFYDEERVQAASDEDRPELDLFASSGSAEVTLADLPSGRMIGNCIHKVFELLDFQETDETQIRLLVERELLHFGIDVSHTDRLTQAVVQILATPLDADGLTLSQLPRGQRLAELDFVFPTRTDPGFSLPELIDTFERYGSPHLEPWLEQLRASHFREARGFLSGSIDLAFRSPRDGRWYVLDWKSNNLGRQVSDYNVPSMRAAMDHHHYHLQYHLYLVAFVRYLRHRLPGFDLDRDLGGAFYLFVRGLSPAHARQTGVYFDRPSPALIQALDEALSAAAPGATR